MSHESTYVKRLRGELVAAGGRLQRERERPPARERSAAGRRTRLRATLALGGVSGVAAIAVLALTVVGLGAGTQQAYAGWTPTPTQPAAGQLAAAEAGCLQLAAANAAREEEDEQHPNRDSRPERGAAPLGSSPNEPPTIPIIQSGEWHRVLSDARGPYTMLIFEAAEGRAKQTCLSSSSGPLYGNGGYQLQVTSPPPGQVEVFYAAEAGHAGAEGLEEGKPYNYIDGQTGSEVTAVTLDLEGGEQVQASVENGWFLAWWPGTEKATKAEVSTASGTSAEQLGE